VVPGSPLSVEQRLSVREAVLGLAARHGFDGWVIDDVVEETRIPSVTVQAQYPSKESLVLDAVLERAREVLDGLMDTAAGSGRTPRSRVLRVLRVLTDSIVESPSSSRAMLRAFTCGQDVVAPILRTFDDHLHMVLARAVAGGEPGDPEWAVSEVVEQVWLASVVVWASNLQRAEYIEESVVRVLRLLKVNG
jgi:AcrR family transcriptional regulator